MVVYRISRWSEIFENNRTKELKRLTWVPVPNSHDGHGYALLLSKKNGPALYGAWMVILQVASRCEARGTLLRGDKRPHTCASLALMTRFPEAVIKECLDTCSDPELGWIVCENSNDSQLSAPKCDTTAPPCDHPAVGCLEGNGREWNGKNNNVEEPEPPPFYSEARIVLHLLNEKSGSHFREVDSNLSIIAARLESVGGDVDGVKAMVNRQCQLWRGDPKMDRYLQPTTLFGPVNFEKYWGARSRTVNGSGPSMNRDRDDSAFLDPRIKDSEI